VPGRRGQYRDTAPEGPVPSARRAAAEPGSARREPPRPGARAR
jgi:hypothetical protein